MNFGLFSIFFDNFQRKCLWFKFYFNFATYLAESHVKPHLLPRGFLEIVNGELKSAKNVDFLISI